MLLLRKRYGDEERFTLPGGSQEPGETLADALRRECREEIGARVELGRLCLVYEYAWRRPDGRSSPHKVEFVFTSAVPDDYRPTAGPRPDPHQVEVLWVPLEELAALALVPRALRELLASVSEGRPLCYCGRVE